MSEDLTGSQDKGLLNKSGEEELQNQLQDELLRDMEQFIRKAKKNQKSKKNEDDIPQIKWMEIFLSKYYYLRYNTVTNRIEYCHSVGDLMYRVLEERDFNSIFRQLQKAGNKGTPELLSMLLNSDFVKEYDPFKEYFEYLEENEIWDGTTDYIQMLADTVQTTNKPFWGKALKKWLVGSVSCALKDREHHEALVFYGKQRVGKSTWLNKLLPEALSGYRYSGTINPNNKDSLINMVETFHINLDELETLRKSELGELKQLLTQKELRLRRPYTRYHETFIRRASFMGSTNEAEFLTDTTGNRRYLCFTTEKINKEHSINMDLVYAQAYSLYKTKFEYWFDGNDAEELDLNNEEYRKRSLEEDLVTKYFEVPEDMSETELMTPGEILGYINEKEKYVRLISSVNLGRALTKLGFDKINKNKEKPYKVILKPIPPKKFPKI